MHKAKKIQRFCGRAFAGFVALIFSVGMGSYFLQNGAALVGLLGDTTPAPSAQPSAQPSPSPSPSPLPHKEVAATVEWKEKPVDFLEEILPELTPDPGRTAFPITELTIDYGGEVENFLVNDSSDSGLNLAEELKNKLGFSCDTLAEPTVLLYHTHSCESYLTGTPGFYYSDTAFRNQDLSRNLAVVGDAMKSSLEAAGIGVIHDTTIHDAPAFNGAYQRSMNTVQKWLDRYPSIKVTIDVHRDSMGTDSGESYKPTALIDGRKAAQVMIIAGSDPTGELEYANWRDNLTFALKIQKKAADLYENLMRPLMYCQRKYNMDATNGSLIFEVGTEVNTFSEAKYSGKLMGDVLAKVLWEGKKA